MLRKIKNQYVQAPILFNPNWEFEFHVHTDASKLAIRTIFAQHPIGKFDQLVMYAFKLLNSVERNYITTEKVQPQLWSTPYKNLNITY